MAKNTNINIAGIANINAAVAMSSGKADQKPFMISPKGMALNLTSDQYFIKNIILIVAKSNKKKMNIFNNVIQIFFMIIVCFFGHIQCALTINQLKF